MQLNCSFTSYNTVVATECDMTNPKESVQSTKIPPLCCVMVFVWAAFPDWSLHTWVQFTHFIMQVMILPEALDYVRATAIALEWPDVGGCASWISTSLPPWMLRVTSKCFVFFPQRKDRDVVCF